jgi:hypothetical protein
MGLIAAGFVAGALVAVSDPDAIRLSWFLPSLGVGVVGVVLVHLGLRRHAQDRSRIEANFQRLDSSLADITKNLRELDAEKDTHDVYALPGKIDELFAEDIDRFVEARESIAHVWGNQAYADIMSHFAAGERYLNRVWSTAADGYIDEAHAYVGRSLEQFDAALKRLEALRSG